MSELLAESAKACREATPAAWTPEDRDAILRGLNTVSYEVVGLAARIRAARVSAVNDTPVPHPVKPLNPPPPPPKPAQPKPAPPPPPPAKPGGGK